jgi:hypothetical protein
MIKKLFENWFQVNISQPYATKKDLLELSKKTGIEMKHILRWLDNRRLKSTLEQRQSRKWSHFIQEETKVLTDFYENKSENPDDKSIEKLAQTLQRKKSEEN